VPSNSPYWDLSKDARLVIDQFYEKEQEYAQFLQIQPDVNHLTVSHNRRSINSQNLEY
jgi:hypothetical protein